MKIKVSSCPWKNKNLPIQLHILFPQMSLQFSYIDFAARASALYSQTDGSSCGLTCHETCSYFTWVIGQAPFISETTTTYQKVFYPFRGQGTIRYLPYFPLSAFVGNTIITDVTVCSCKTYYVVVVETLDSSLYWCFIFFLLFTSLRSFNGGGASLSGSGLRQHCCDLA